MDTSSNEKKVKSAKPSAHSALRVRKETRKRVLGDLARANKKDFGKTIRVDEYIALAIGLIQPEHIQRLQEGSLSNADRFEREYRAYVAQHGHISKDDYLGRRLASHSDALPEKSKTTENATKTL